jgi:outer membrane protein TolC
VYYSINNRRNTAILSISFIIVLLFWIQDLNAESPHAPAMYALSDLLAAAQAHSPDLESLQNAVAQQQIKESELPWWDSPEVRMGYGRDAQVSSEYRSNDSPNHEYDVALRVYPRNPWERSATLTKLRSETRLSELALQARTQEINAAIQGIYWELSYQCAQAALQEQRLTLYQDQANAMETLLQSGQINLSQSLPAKMKQIDASLRVDAYASDISRLRDQLSQLTGVNAAEIQVADMQTLSADSFDLAMETWLQRAMENRIELKQYDDAIRHSQAELKELRAKNLPWIKHLQANYEVNNDYGDQDAAGIEIAITLPFFASDHGAQQSNLSSLSSQRRQRSAYAGQIRAEVHGLVNQFNHLQQAWSSQERNMPPLVDDLEESIVSMQTQNLQATRNYRDALLTLLEISRTELEMARTYQELALKAERILGEPLRQEP